MPISCFGEICVWSGRESVTDGSHRFWSSAQCSFVIHLATMAVDCVKTVQHSTGRLLAQVRMCVYWGGGGAGGELTARADGDWGRRVEPSAALGRVRGGWGRSGRDGALGRVRAGGWGGAGRGGVGVGGGEFGRRRLWRGRWRGRRLLRKPSSASCLSGEQLLCCSHTLHS